jgi:predicted ribonuclease YlaK
VPLGEDIGFLPGTEEEKMQPWMGALEDNLDVLNVSDESGGEWGRAATRDLVRSRIRIKSLNFMRGRTFIHKWLIIDEAQNLTPKQMKTLVTRAGPGTKVACLGNIAQIDTPYLTEGSSGLSYVVVPPSVSSRLSRRSALRCRSRRRTTARRATSRRSARRARTSSGCRRPTTSSIACCAWRR